jgi:hypothetical protein
MQSVSKNFESAAIAAYAQSAMRFACGKVRVLRYGKRVAVPLQRVARATTRTIAGLQEIAASAQFAPMQFEARTAQDTRYMQMRNDARALQVNFERSNPANTLPYAMVAYRLQLRTRAANAAMHR